jgi:drug/metabolite transporter (DMT)-like permease
MFRRFASAASGNALLLLPIAAASWAGNQVVGRAVAGHVPPAGLTVLRWTLALLIILPFARPHLVRDRDRIIAGWRPLLFLGIVGGAAFSTLQYVGLEHTTALNMAVLNSLPPAVIVAVSLLLFGDPVRPWQLVGLAVSLLGVLVIVTQGLPGRLLGLDLNIGDLIIVANMLLWSVYSACLRLRPNVHWLSFLVVIAVLSVLGNLPFLAIEHMAGKRLEASGATLGAVLFTALFPSVLAYACWSRGIELIGAPRAGAFLHLIPLFGVILSTQLLGEQLGHHHVLGVALILLGVRLATAPR